MYIWYDTLNCLHSSFAASNIHRGFLSEGKTILINQGILQAGSCPHSSCHNMVAHMMFAANLDGPLQ